MTMLAFRLLALTSMVMCIPCLDRSDGPCTYWIDESCNRPVGQLMIPISESTVCHLEKLRERYVASRWLSVNELRQQTSEPALTNSDYGQEARLISYLHPTQMP